VSRKVFATAQRCRRKAPSLLRFAGALQSLAEVRCLFVVLCHSRGRHRATNNPSRWREGFLQKSQKIFRGANPAGPIAAGWKTGVTYRRLSSRHVGDRPVEKPALRLTGQTITMPVNDTLMTEKRRSYGLTPQNEKSEGEEQYPVYDRHRLVSVSGPDCRPGSLL